MDYGCKTASPQVELDCRELQTYAWVKPEDALRPDTEEYTRNFVLKYLERLGEGT
jgi:hypothetical protein